MSFDQIKAEFTTFTRELRRELIGHLLALGRKDDLDFVASSRRRSTAKIQPTGWRKMTLITRWDSTGPLLEALPSPQPAMILANGRSQT